MRSPYPNQRFLPRRHTEPLHILYSDASRTSSTTDGSSYSTSPSLHDIAIQADHRSLLSIYLLCRVLIEIYNQTNLASLTPQMADKLEDIIFLQVKQIEPEQLVSPFRLANWNIYCQLLSVMSEMNLQSVTQRFINELRSTQKDISQKEKPSKEAETKFELIIMATRHLRVKTQPETTWKTSCDFLLAFADLFVNSHGQDIKHAYCQALEDLVVPIAANASSLINTPKWKD